MAGVSNDPNPSVQATKHSKIKSKKPTSTVSQKTIVAKTKPNTKPEGSVKMVSEGEGGWEKS